MDLEQERWRQSIDRALESFRETAEFIRKSTRNVEDDAAGGGAEISPGTGSPSSAP